MSKRVAMSDWGQHNVRESGHEWLRAAQCQRERPQVTEGSTMSERAATSDWGQHNVRESGHEWLRAAQCQRERPQVTEGSTMSERVATSDWGQHNVRESGHKWLRAAQTMSKSCITLGHSKGFSLSQLYNKTSTPGPHWHPQRSWHTSLMQNPPRTATRVAEKYNTKQDCQLTQACHCHLKLSRKHTKSQLYDASDSLTPSHQHWNQCHSSLSCTQKKKYPIHFSPQKYLELESLLSNQTIKTLNSYTTLMQFTI